LAPFEQAPKRAARVRAAAARHVEVIMWYISFVGGPRCCLDP
jgi:hypothetical protein